MCLICRFAHYYVEDGVDKRVLYKAYGIRFVFSVTGQAGKFSFVPMMLNIGSGLALLSIVSVPLFIERASYSFIHISS